MALETRFPTSMTKIPHPNPLSKGYSMHTSLQPLNLLIFTKIDLSIISICYKICIGMCTFDLRERPFIETPLIHAIDDLCIPTPMQEKNLLKGNL
jgi:hypothetical protein